MSKLQIRALAVALWLITVACTIAYLAMREEYTMFADGPAVTATVTAVEPSSRNPERTTITVRYRDGDREVEHQLRGRADDPHHQVGATLELRLQRNSHHPITADRVDSFRPSVFLLVGAIAGLVLGVLVWRIPSHAARRRAARTDPLDAVVDAVARTRNHSLGGGVFLIVAAVGFSVIPIVDGDAGTGATVFIEALAGLSLLLGVVLVRRAYRLRDPRDNDLMGLIVDRPDELAWYYVHALRSKGGTNYSIHLWTCHGKRVELTLVEEDLEAVMAELARRAPHACTGYDRENHRLYRERPDRWRPRPG